MKTPKKTKRKGVRHHAKRLYHLTPKFVHGMVAGAFIGTIVVTSLSLVRPANALSLASARDCDSNAVINCGALTTTELQQRYNNKGVPAVFKYFRIGSDDIKATHKTAVAGRVHKNGNVTIGGKIVATKAITAGRENISGSTRISSGGATFYTRPPSVSFRVSSIAAFVIMEDGQFKYAVIGSCGNPVKATPVPKTVKPPPEPPEVVTALAPEKSTQTPESTPTPAVVASAAEVTLPSTGPSDILIVGLLSVIGGYIFHVTHRHVRHKRHLRHSA